MNTASVSSRLAATWSGWRSLQYGTATALGTTAPDESGDRAHVLVTRAERAVGQSQVDSPGGAEHLTGRLGLGEPFVDRAVAAHLAGREIAHADAIAERGVPGDRAADPDLDVVGMRADRQQIDGIDRAPDAPEPKGGGRSSRPAEDLVRLVDLAADRAGQDSRRHERAGNRVAAAAECEQVTRIVAVRPDVHQAIRGLAVRQVPAVLRLQSGYRRIHHQQLVHQLSGSLHEQRRRAAAPAFRPGPRPTR